MNNNNRKVYFTTIGHACSRTEINEDSGADPEGCGQIFLIKTNYYLIVI